MNGDDVCVKAKCDVNLGNELRRGLLTKEVVCLAPTMPCLQPREPLNGISKV